MNKSRRVPVLLTISNFILYLRLGDLDWMGGAMSGTVYNSSQELGTLMTEVQQNLLLFCMVGCLLGLLVDWIFSILILSVKVNAGVLVLAVALAGVRPRSLDQPSPLGRIPRAEEDGGRGRFNLSCFSPTLQNSHIAIHPTAIA